MDELLAELNRRDIALWLDGAELRVTAPAGALTDELRAALRRHRDSLLAAMRSAPPATAAAPQAITADTAHRFEPFGLTDLQHAYWIGRGSAVEFGNVATHFYAEY